MSRYRFVDGHCGQVPVRILYAVLQIAPSSYYAWRQRRLQPAPAWERAIVWAFQCHGRRYGTRRLRAEVHAEGYRIRRVLAAHRLRAHYYPARSYRALPIPGTAGAWRLTACWASRAPPPQPGLDRRHHVLAPGQEACSRKVVGWDVRETMPADLVSEALRRDLVARQPPAGLIVPRK